MALLVVTLAVVIVSGMLWRQQVEIRAVENQRLKAQASWIARAGVDWARLILRDDQRRTGAVDHLGEIWAVPIQETKLSDFLGSSLRTDAAGEESYLSGRIFDAQARFNLMNLLTMQTLGSRTIVTGRDKDGIKAYGLLLQSLNLDPSLANVTATYLAQMLGGFQSAEVAKAAAKIPAAPVAALAAAATALARWTTSTACSPSLATPPTPSPSCAPT